MFNDLFAEWQQAKIVVLTPNKRSARTLLQRFDFAQRQQGKKAWPTPAIYPFSTWASLLWQQLGNQPYLLNNIQWQHLWEKVITAKDCELLAMKSTAIAAWTLCHDYLIDIKQSSFTYNEDSQLWYNWAKQIQQQLSEHQYIDSSQLLTQLTNKKFEYPLRLYLINFIQFTPAQQRFLNSLKKQGVTLISRVLGNESSEVSKNCSADPRTDLQNMVKWAIQSAENNTVACVIPNLAEKKEQIDYLFKAYLNDTSLYNISLGKPLIEHRLIKHAISALNFEHKHQTVDAWVNDIQHQLKINHWPGETLLNSEAFQLLDAWHDLLNNFLSLSHLHKTLSNVEAIASLREIAKTTIFQMQTSPQTKIHVLGILEAAGLTFDALWVANMHERAWPPANITNPFIPRSLQIKFNLPHANSASSLTFQQGVISQLQHAAPQVIFSYPLHDGEEALRESSAIRQFTIKTINIPEYLTHAEKLLGKSKLEYVMDESGPAVDINTLKHRGSQIFKDQAACPFRAYAKIRLGASSVELPQLGFRAIQRGQIMHAVLENIWRVIRSHEQLCQFDEQTLQQLLLNIIHKVLQAYVELIPPFFISLEKQRLLPLITQWLQLEKQRDSFVVIATEENIEVTYAGFPLRLRVDRIDQIADNEYLILDYKTSICSTSDWFGERPDEPQLPLYCIVSALPVTAIAFAQIRANDMKLKRTDIVKNYINTWELQLQQLATEFLNGHAAVQPKYGDQTCRLCDLSMLCRIKERL